MRWGPKGPLAARAGGCNDQHRSGSRTRPWLTCRISVAPESTVERPTGGRVEGENMPPYLLFLLAFLAADPDTWPLSLYAQHMTPQD